MKHDVEFNKSLIKDCIRLIAAPKTTIYFSRPLIVEPFARLDFQEKRKPLFCCIGCCFSIEEKLMVVDEQMEWHVLHEANANVGYILQGLHRKLKALCSKV